MGARAQGAQTWPRFRPEGGGGRQGSPFRSRGLRRPKRTLAALQACAGGAASCSPSWAQREPSLAPGTRAPPPSPVPPLTPPGQATRTSEEAGRPRHRSPRRRSRASTAAVAACSRRPRAPPPGRAGRDRRASEAAAPRRPLGAGGRSHSPPRPTPRRTPGSPDCCPRTPPSPRPRRLDSTRTSRPQ